ncbi:hypothetical protein [Grimontia marina]|uniref:Porin domain-containing protein n=1 Tax=Grimontia marina TaxID=646534 RepID=A0A128EXP1_9GAMM|nr:hypothetical protein [Grimontia marina]CZF79343.1 hypothetical protein GMA8713_00931 [Grimontia marina]
MVEILHKTTFNKRNPKYVLYLISVPSMIRNNSLRPLKLILFAASVATLASVNAVASEHLQLSGFGNLSAIHSGTDDFGYVYDLTKDPIYGELSLDAGSSIGLQLNARFSYDWDFVVQGVIKDRIQNNLDKSITWAFLRYKVSPAVSVRVGRIATPIYMLSEYRDVGFAYLWTKPVTDFYANIPVTSLNGGDIAYTTPLSDGIIEARVFGGQSEVSINTIFSSYEVTLSPMIGTKLSFYSDRWNISGSAATAKVDEGNPASSLITFASSNSQILGLWPSLQNTLHDFEVETTRFYYYSLGAQYETEDWSIQAELSYTDADWPFFPDLMAGYTSLGKTINDLTIYGFASKAKSVGDFYELEPPSITALTIPEISYAYGIIKSNLNARVIDQETLGIGARYYINSQLSLKGQIERSWLNNDRIGSWSVNEKALTKPVPDYIDTISIGLSFVF